MRLLREYFEAKQAIERLPNRSADYWDVLERLRIATNRLSAFEVGQRQEQG